MVWTLGFGTDAQDLESVRKRRKAVLPADLVAQLPELFAVELDHFSARHAYQIVVAHSASNYLVIGLLVVKEYLLEDSGVLKVGKSTINGGAGDAIGDIFQLRHQLIGLEESFLAEGGVEDHGPLGREFQLVIVQVAPEDGADGLVRQDLALGFGGIFLFWDAGKNMRPLGHRTNVDSSSELGKLL